MLNCYPWVLKSPKNPYSVQLKLLLYIGSTHRLQTHSAATLAATLKRSQKLPEKNSLIEIEIGLICDTLTRNSYIFFNL